MTVKSRTAAAEAAAAEVLPDLKAWLGDAYRDDYAASVKLFALQLPTDKLREALWSAQSNMSHCGRWRGWRYFCGTVPQNAPRTCRQPAQELRHNRAAFFRIPTEHADQQTHRPRQGQRTASALVQLPLYLQDGSDDFNIILIHSLLDDYGLSPQQFRVYAHLARRGSSGAAWPSVATVAQVCQVHLKTARRALHVLVEHRLVTREHRPGKTPLYRITPAREWHPPINIKAHPSETDTHPKRIPDTPPKRSQRYPSQMDTDEGNPIEGNPMKGTHPLTPRGGLCAGQRFSCLDSGGGNLRGLSEESWQTCRAPRYPACALDTPRRVPIGPHQALCRYLQRPGSFHPAPRHMVQ